MAIISCIDCGKNVSSRSPVCPYCGFQRDEVAEERLRELSRRKLRDRIYHLKMISYLALSLLLGAFGWYLMEANTTQLQFASSTGPFVLFAVGFVCYCIVRVYLYKAKAALRKLGF
jgi:hypothetical protein